MMAQSSNTTYTWWNNKFKVDSYWKLVTYILLGLCTLFLVYFSVNSGPNADDRFQNYYADNVLDFYTTLGQDTSVLYNKYGYVKYYGGLYEIPSAIINATLGFEKFDSGYHLVRHLLNSLFAMLAICSMVLLGKRILSWRTAAIIAFLFLCSPVFLFHGAVNPKDIPFAMGMGLSLLAMWMWLKQWPTPSWKSTVFLGVAMGTALAIRVGGVLAYGYLGIFSLALLIYYRKKYKISKILPQILLHGLVSFLISYVICVIFWPYALQDPIGNVIDSVQQFNAFPIGISVLFNGENVPSTQVTRWYTAIWMYKTIALIVLLGLALSLAFANVVIKRIGVYAYGILVFATFFPLIYLIYQGSNVYDGWRHSTFIYLPLVCLAGIGIDVLWHKYLPKGSKFYYAAPAIVLLFAIHPIIHNIKYPGYAYVFFNMLNNSPEQVTGQYETDYWGMSVEQAIEWMDDKGILSEKVGDITIASHLYYPLKVALRSRGYSKEEIKTVYTRYGERFNQKWDYAIYPARFVPAAQLRSGNYPGTYAIKTFYVDGSPICTILKAQENHPYLKAVRALQNNQVEMAKQLFLKVMEEHPDNVFALRQLMGLYLNNSDFQELKNVIKQYRIQIPESAFPYIYEGIMYLQTRQVNKALSSFNTAIRLEPNAIQALYYKAVILKSMKRSNDAIALVNKILELRPRYKRAYLLLSDIYNEMGDKVRARQYKQIAEQL